MCRTFFFALLFAVTCGLPIQGAGLLIPADRKLPPLAMVNHRVQIEIEDQVAITTIEQSFRNHTDRQLEATFLFPIPRGASVNKFTMWVNDKETNGELLDSKKASQVYTDIVRRTQDPGLLEYLGNNLMRLRVFPVLPKSDQKVKISFTSVAQKDNGVVEYIYPLKTDGKATKTLEEFSIKATLKSQHAIQNVYSPTHAITLNRSGDKEVRMAFERNQALLDKDFQLFYTLGDNEIGITPLTYRPISSEDGYFLLLISPQLEASKSTTIPRDLVLVLDTSGSMDNVKMDQARRALKHCLSQLRGEDRFGIVSFSTAARRYRDSLVEANGEQLDNAKKWVDGLRAGGGTNIQSALDSAISMRAKEAKNQGRSFTMVFFTDGQPTIGEMKPENILKNISAKNSDNTRVFTFGVGDDVNTALLDQLADTTRALSTYVRPAEDIETKATSLYGKISHPVLANVKLTTGENVKLEDVYPTSLPDLFFGSQLVVLGKYSGSGPCAIKLNGQVGKDSKEFVYEVNFSAKTEEGHDFVEHLWARRKVGFLLDQIRMNGEHRELMDEMMSLAKKYGIATPYTSYLVVPDAPLPIINSPSGGPVPLTFRGAVPAGPAGRGGMGGGLPATEPAALSAPSLTGKEETTRLKVADFAREVAKKPGDTSKARYGFNGDQLQKLEDELDRFNKSLPKPQGNTREDAEKKAVAESAKQMLDSVKDARDQHMNYERARTLYGKGDYKNAQVGKIGVDIAVCSNNLRQQERLTPTASRNVQGRNCIELGGLWIDESFTADMKMLVVKAQSDAYFKILEAHPKMKEVFLLGNHTVFVTPSKVALVIDDDDGKLTLSEKEIEDLFVVKK